VFYIDEDFWALNTTLYVKDFKENHPLFIYFLLKTIDFNSCSDKSSVPGVNRNDLHLIKVNLPPLTEQKAIARILGVLDDKIELNQKMNQTLEAMAQAIFKSWFVDFDPVRAKMAGQQPVGMDEATAALFPDSIEDSELGEIPKGWKVKPLPEIIEVNPKRTLVKGKIAPYLDMKNMPTEGHRAATWIDREVGSGTKFINGDTLMARITPCLENGKTAYVDFLEDGQVGWGSTEYLIFRPKSPLPLEFGYYLARSEELRTFAMQNMTGSSGRQRTPANCFDNYLMPLPSEEIAHKFGEIVAPSMRMKKANSEQSQTLTALRDTLLPKLMSGELRVPEADRQIAELV
jgi:type I restriction enzyme, S subunit